MAPWLDTLRELNLLSIVVRIVLAMSLGGILGLERGRKGRAAGFRTYMLVSLGAALVMMTNQFVALQFGTGDPVRMGAQVISGIGFLGAGTIIITGRSRVQGITTAAGLWVSACGGLAIGIGFYEGAIIGGLAIFIIMSTMQRLDDHIHNHAPVLDAYMEFDNRTALSTCFNYLRENEFEVTDIRMPDALPEKRQGLYIIVSIKSHKKRSHPEMLEALSRSPGVVHVEKL